MNEPNSLTRMKLSECWGDSLNVEELKELNDYIEKIKQKNQQLKEKNELEFNDFIKFKKEQEDRHLEEKDKLIKENYHLRKQLQQRDEVIEECIESIQNFMTHIDDGFCADMMTFIDILNKYKGE